MTPNIEFSRERLYSTDFILTLDEWNNCVIDRHERGSAAEDAEGGTEIRVRQGSQLLSV